LTPLLPGPSEPMPVGWEFRREELDRKGYFGGRALMSIEAGTNLR
jgi:hypothetical protein